MYASRDHLHEYLCQPLVPLLDGLWVDLLGSTSNSMHWIMGSDSSAHYLGECSLLDDLPRVAGLLGICLDLRTGKRSGRLNLTFTRVRAGDLQALIDGMGNQGARPC
jgi:hypothetical protein